MLVISMLKDSTITRHESIPIKFNTSQFTHVPFTIPTTWHHPLQLVVISIILGTLIFALPRYLSPGRPTQSTDYSVHTTQQHLPLPPLTCVIVAVHDRHCSTGAILLNASLLLQGCRRHHPVARRLHVHIKWQGGGGCCGTRVAGTVQCSSIRTAVVRQILLQFTRIEFANHTASPAAVHPLTFARFQLTAAYSSRLLQWVRGG